MSTSKSIACFFCFAIILVYLCIKTTWYKPLLISGRNNQKICASVCNWGFFINNALRVSLNKYCLNT